MPRLLIVNCTRDSLLQSLGALGSRSYDAQFIDSVRRHLPDRVPLETFTLNIGDSEGLPQGAQLGDFDGAWLSGSPLNVYRLDQPTVRAQLDLARAVWQAGVPAFGSCWGLQLMTAALGGTVHLNPNGREIGVARRIAPTEAGRRHALFDGKSGPFDALCSHEDEVETLPAGAELLASNAVSRVQAMAIREGGRSFWGVQYHPEFDFGAVAAIIALRVQRHLDEGLARSEGEVDTIVSDFRSLTQEEARKDLAWKYGLHADVLDPKVRTAEFGNWLKTEVLPRAGR
ncbi:MAG: type 1 glutamine amidotransferase [Reyranella sp.]|uniref:type 1 glutamine amidotransferase n=1 Tax=Reyranella sp. TaxID=1929291 RepID=UPI001ACD582D|nr:type 1 glutamine amidotransferase [Reyranella sp.]MBN9086834.1 type 1 glutamine amidotransferase [Reyranella sp.]